MQEMVYEGAYRVSVGKKPDPVIEHRTTPSCG
jgi:hypothetical protein